MRRKKPEPLPPGQERHCSVCGDLLTPENWYGGERNYLCITHQNAKAIESRRSGTAQEGSRRRQREWNARHEEKVRANVDASRRRRKLGIVSAGSRGRPRTRPIPPAPANGVPLGPLAVGWASSPLSRVDHYLEESGSSLCRDWYWPNEERRATTTRPCMRCARALERKVNKRGPKGKERAKAA